MKHDTGVKATLEIKDRGNWVLTVQKGLPTLPDNLDFYESYMVLVWPPADPPNLSTSVYKLLWPETESEVKSAAVFSKLLRRPNQPNQSSPATEFVFDSNTELLREAAICLTAAQVYIWLISCYTTQKTQHTIREVTLHILGKVDNNNYTQNSKPCFR